MKTLRKPKCHSPVLLNAREIARAKGCLLFVKESFEMSLGDNAKVAIPGVVPEFMWLEVVGANKNYMTGVLRSKLDSTDMQPGDLVRFCQDNIFQIKRRE